MEREETKLTGCLLQSGTSYPQEKIIVCGLCPNRSSDRGNLGTQCVHTPSSK